MGTTRTFGLGPSSGRTRSLAGAMAAAAFALAVVAGAPPACAAADAAGAPVATPTAFEPGSAASSAAPAADTAIKAWLDQPGSLTIAGERVHPAELRRFYALHGFLPVWDSRPQVAQALWHAVLQAGQQGLDPNLFHAAALANPAGLSPIDRDLLLSDAFLAYADALACGAVPIEARSSNEALSPAPVDTVAVVDAAIGAADPAAAIEALAPSTPEYAALRRAYQTYRAIAASGGWPRVDDDDSPAGVRRLQQRLAAEDYLPAGYASGRYDTATTAALRAFQRDHGLGVDGVLGPATISVLNVGADARAQQVAVNLERLRWLPRNLPPDRVWVNTASERLQYFRDNTPIFATRVVVGETDKQTPEFSSTIDSLLFNPPWHVPYSIAKSEILPKLASEPDYLAKHNMVMRSNGSIEQLPGREAALGQLKFEMNDAFDVYLHDTPQKSLFARGARLDSHGCIRVEQPRQLAALLADESVDEIDRRIDLGHTNRRYLPAPVPTFIVYQTAYLGEDGRIAFRHDVYRRDDPIWRHLVPTGQVPLAGQDPPAPRGG